MELTMRTIVVLIILLIATFVFASIIMGWGTEVGTWLNATLTSFQNMVLPR